MIKITRKSMLSYIVKPLFCIFLLCSVFAIVWLRSNLISIEYEISRLESEKIQKQRETRLLVAERAEILSFQKIKLVTVKQGLDLVDRTRVLKVKRPTDAHRASYEMRR